MSVFYLEVLASDRVDIHDIQAVIVDAVEETVFSISADQGIDLTLCGFYWDSRPGCRQVFLMASMEARCGACNLRDALVSGLRDFQCEGAPDVVVDTGGYGPPGEETNLATWVFWQGLCLQKAWPNLLPQKAVRFGDPWDHVQRLDVDGSSLGLYTMDDEGESTPGGTCASLEEEFNALRVKDEESFFDCDDGEEPSNSDWGDVLV